MKIKHIVSCFFVSLIGLSACSIEELPYNQLTEDELDGSYESLLSATRGNYAVFKQTAFHQGWHYAGELASDNVSLSGVSSDALMYIYNYQRITDNYHMSNMWGWAYRSIINSNKILEKAQEGESKEMVKTTSSEDGWNLYWSMSSVVLTISHRKPTSGFP